LRENAVSHFPGQVEQKQYKKNHSQITEEAAGDHVIVIVKSVQCGISVILYIKLYG